MKTELKAKFLQHLLKKKQGDQGFTLIELLVVIIIIGILSAIALPSFLNQAAKARGAEAKSNIGAMNRAQQAYFLEQQTFTSDVPALGLSMKTSTDNFTYTAAVNSSAPLAPTSSSATAAVTNLGTSLKPDIKSYAGGTFYTTGSTTTILCEAKAAAAAAADAPTNSTTCGGNTTQVK
ncbi:type IV pilin-like G/H family protein [Chroococcidiopsis sp. CCMEE 29]|uniref:type IV pilin-like G/H family protein n=1 Tax=Chroococcidiopsis sp. CCMEE 29 TaxID=155894 RepID=UPI0023DF9620|nr:type IV pilin-like G/H family protein [Chroococcidiopsis sp. CCMEE 29]